LISSQSRAHPAILIPLREEGWQSAFTGPHKLAKFDIFPTTSEDIPCPLQKMVRRRDSAGRGAVPFAPRPFAKWRDSVRASSCRLKESGLLAGLYSVRPLPPLTERAQLFLPPSAAGKGVPTRRIWSSQLPPPLVTIRAFLAEGVTFFSPPSEGGCRWSSFLRVIRRELLRP